MDLGIHSDPPYGNRGRVEEEDVWDIISLPHQPIQLPRVLHGTDVL